MKRELEQLKSRLEVGKNTVISSHKGALKSVFVDACVGVFVQEEIQRVRAETKLDINLENSRVFDMVCV